jgi:putative Holliday junction resolvase
MMSDMSAAPERYGRVMALDLGEKRIGVAVSDEQRMIARSYAVLKRKSRRDDYERFVRIIEEQQIRLLIVGLPIMLNGEEGRQAIWVRDYAEELRGCLNIPVKFWDESLTTIEAKASLRARGYGHKRMQAKVDAVAAAIILQSYLDSGQKQDLHDK